MPDDLPPETGGDRAWHWREQEADEQAAPPQTARLQQLSLLVLAIAVLGGAAFGLFTWLRSGKSTPKFVTSLIVWEHGEPLYPPHAVALQDSEAILRHYSN